MFQIGKKSKHEKRVRETSLVNFFQGAVFQLEKNFGSVMTLPMLAMIIFDTLREILVLLFL